jgi:hypothetical protein
MDTKVSQENLKSDNLFSGVEWRMTFKKIWKIRCGKVYRVQKSV